MWLSLPSRFQWPHILAFAGLLSLFLLLSGSTPIIVGYIFLYVVMAADAFNRCGGLQYPSGAYVFFHASFALIVGVAAKAVFWEPVQSNLLSPEKTFQVYTGGMAAIWAAALFTWKFRAKKALLQDVIKPNIVGQVVAGCIFTGCISLVYSIYAKGTENSGSLASALQQVNLFMPFGIMLSAYYRAKETGGRSSITLPGLAVMIGLFLYGITMSSKQAMFTGFVCWVVGVAAAGYYISKIRLLILVTIAAVCAPVLAAYSQFARNDLENHRNPIAEIVNMIQHPQETIQQGVSDESAYEDSYHFFNHPHGFLDRLNMLAPDDAIIDLTDTSHEHGMEVVWANFYNQVPHFLAPNKPTLNFGNTYAHELGMLAREDVTTGVSFSPVGEGYHIAGWFGIFVVLPLVLMALFWLTDSFAGSVRKAPWAMLFILKFVHMAPEGGISDIIYNLGLGFVAPIACVIVCVYIAPLVGTLIVGPEKRGIMLDNKPLSARR